MHLIHRLATTAFAAGVVIASALGINAPTAQGTPSTHVITAPATYAVARTTVAWPMTAMPSTTNYPWAGLTSSNGGDQWGMGYGQCVSYIAWMVYQNSGGTQRPSTIPTQGWFPSDGLAKGPVRYNWGNAGDWNTSAASAGFAVSGTPTVGSIAQWVNGSDSGQFTVGHVAYVTAVNSDGSIDLAQYNLREDSRFSTLHMPRRGATDTSNGHGAFFVNWPDHFLHIDDGGISNNGRPYRVTGGDSQGLAIQSQPHVNHVLSYAANGTTLYVQCQTNHGDQVDSRAYNGKPYTTWDQLTDGTWVYDWYMNTPTIGSNGYSPGIPACSGG